MHISIRIDGVYDQRTLDAIKKINISEMAFDFRPKSFNFLQHHKFMEIIEKNYSPFNRYFLHFSNEADFVISKFVNDLKGLLSSKDPLYRLENNFYLEFSDNREIPFYDQFKVPYYWHYDPETNIKDVLASNYIKGIVLSYSILERMFEEGSFANFVQNFHLQAFKTLEQKGIRLALSLDWSANIFPSLFDFIDFELISLPINQKIEVCYRNVDLPKLEKEVKHYLRMSI